MKHLLLTVAACLAISVAHAAQPMIPLSGGGTIELGPAHDGRALIVDATAGDTTPVIF